MMGLIKPCVDILFTQDAETVLGGMTWLKGEMRQICTSWIQTYLLENRLNGLSWVVGMVVVMGSFMVCTGGSHRFYSRMLARRFQVSLSERLYGRLLLYPVNEIQRRRQGDVMSRFSTDISLVQEAILDFFQILLKEPFVIIFALTYLLLINWKATALTLSVFPFVGLLIAFLNRRVRSSSLRESEVAGRLFHQVSESIHGLMVIKIFQSESRLLKQFRSECREYLKHVRRVVRIEAFTSPAVDFLGYLAVAALLFLFGPLVFEGSMSSGDFIVLVALMLKIYQPVKAIANSTQKMSRSLSGAERVLELMNVEEESSNGSRTFDENFDKIVFKEVNFSYPGGVQVLKDISFEIRRGETVALVGATGAGKSTLMHLLPGLYRVDKGVIEIGGVPMEDLSLESLRSRMALVSQHIFLFNESVYNNIAMSEEVDRETVLQAARVAGVDEFVGHLADGYETLVGDRGVLLSGGQRQRISIARAILKKPAILLLDEATSALDSQTELQVQQAIDELSKGRTTLTIAHRLSTVQRADRIIVLGHGQILESGTHAELLERGGAYHQLHTASLGNEDLRALAT